MHCCGLRTIGCVVLFQLRDYGTYARQNTHREVKAKILERMAEWAEMFARDPDLGIMEQAYGKLKSQSIQSQRP